MKKSSFSIPSVEMHPWDRRIEIISAILMSIATVSSAWCAYQSARWGGEQAFFLSEAAGMGRESARNMVQAGQVETLDAAMFMEYTRALSEKNSELANFLYQRFRPELKTATDAWLALKPLQNPSAPASPFEMKEYIIPEQEKAKDLSTTVYNKVNEARNANRISDNYILFTVIFASVLFFAGIATKFQSRRLKAVILAIGWIVYCSGVGWLITLPVY